MKKTLVIISSFICLALIYFLFSPLDYVIYLDQYQLQQRIDKKLPLRKTFLRKFDITLNNAKVALREGNDRIRVGLDVKFDIKGSKSMQGSLGVTGGLKYSAQKGQLFLTNPLVEELSIPGLFSRRDSALRRALIKSLQYYFSLNPVYTLREDTLKHKAARLVLKNVIIEKQRVVITLST